MRFSYLLLYLSIASGVYFTCISAWQIIKKDRIIWINRQSLPVWIWILGILISSLLTTLEILRYVDILLLFPVNFITMIYVLILFVLAIYGLAVILIQYSPPQTVLSSREKILRSILSGFAASFELSAVLSMLWILSGASAASNVGGLICLLIPTQIIATIGTYLKLGWQKKFEENAKAFYENHKPKDSNGTRS